MHFVLELLANEGTIPQLESLNQKRPILNKKNGVIFSVFWFIFFTMFMTSVFGIMGVDVMAGICAVTGVFGSILLVIASLVMLPSSKQKYYFSAPQAAAFVPAALHAKPGQGALPPVQAVPAQVYAPPAAGSWRTPETGEFARPASVTEDTTKLLQKEREP